MSWEWWQCVAIISLLGMTTVYTWILFITSKRRKKIMEEIASMVFVVSGFAFLAFLLWLLLK